MGENELEDIEAAEPPMASGRETRLTPFRPPAWPVVMGIVSVGLAVDLLLKYAWALHDLSSSSGYWGPGRVSAWDVMRMHCRFAPLFPLLLGGILLWLRRRAGVLLHAVFAVTMLSAWLTVSIADWHSLCYPSYP